MRSFKNSIIIFLLGLNVVLINTSYSKQLDPDIILNKNYAKHSYVCIPTEKTGFKYNKASRKWESVRDRTQSDKKLLKWKDNKWILSNFGEKDEQSCNNYEYSWAYKAKEQFNNRKYTISLRCILDFGEFSFNKKTLKYTQTYTAGYASTSDIYEPAFVEIGTCAQL